jgi:hypothetical protein
MQYRLRLVCTPGFGSNNRSRDCVVELLAFFERFVCDELNTGTEDNARLVDENRIGTIPRSVILRREAFRWKAFTVSSDLLSIKELPAFCRLEIQAGSGPVDLSTRPQSGVSRPDLTRQWTRPAGALSGKIKAVLGGPGSFLPREWLT